MESSLTEYLLPGMLLGVAGALVPGPLMALLFSETVRHGVWGGIKVSMVPLLVDTPVILIALLLAKSIETSPTLLGIIAMIGAVVLALLAFHNVRSKQSDFQFEHSNSNVSLAKGIAVHMLNPNLYIHWFSIATPIFAVGTALENFLFAGGSLITSVFVMWILVVGVARLRTHFFDHMYIVLRVLGVALFFFAYKLGMLGMQFFSV